MMSRMQIFPVTKLSYHLRMGMTQRFLMFFLLTAILPVVLIGGLLLHKVHARLDEERIDLLRTGRLLTQTVLRSDMEQMELDASQAAYVWANHSYQAGNTQELEFFLNRLQQSQGLDIVALIDPYGESVASSSFAGDVDPASFRMLVRAALAGKNANSIEQFRIGARQPPSLYYLAAVPVRHVNQSKAILGALILGQSVEKNFSFEKLTTTLPELEIRILQRGQTPTSTMVFNSTGDLKMPNDRNNVVYDESISKRHYMSLGMPLKNFRKVPVGQVIISTPALEEADLERSGAPLIAVGLLIALFCISAAGYWFHRTFVLPMYAISQASAQVAQGNLSVSVPEGLNQKDMRRTTRNFNLMIHRLQQDEQLRNTFISCLTHDLRTPLLAERRVIELFTEFGNELPEQFLTLTANLQESNEHLLSMVGKLLETFQYEAGYETMSLTTIDIGTLAEGVIAQMTPLAEGRHIGLERDIPGNLPPLQGDREQLTRVFINLIGNAIENIPPVGDKVHISAALEDEEEGEVMLIRIADNGPGLPLTVRKRLFERYSVGHRAQKIGSGLGLFICKLIVERHGGTIEADTREGRGTVFRIRLPLHPFEPEGASE